MALQEYQLRLESGETEVLNYAPTTISIEDVCIGTNIKGIWKYFFTVIINITILLYNYIILRLDNHVPFTFEENERIEDDINDDDEELCYEDVVNICEEEPNIEKISVANSQTNENVASNSQIGPHRRRAKKVQRNRK